jgi:hypothetical protein
MASTETRPSFRLPWSTGPAESDERAETRVEASTEGRDNHDHEETQAPDMIEIAAPAPTTSQSEPSGTAPARRATKFMADLSHAMQAAAATARNETMERFQAEAKAVVEEIHANATNEVADLRRQADDDVAAIRDWSKAEIARIREETESRIAARKNGLESEIEAHASTIDARTERVTAVVAAFEAEMNAFFDHLNAEEDPTRIATMAETMPDPPSLEAIAATTTAAEPRAIAAPEPEAVPEPVVEAKSEDATTSIATAEIDFAAAEAEALSFDGDPSTLGDLDDTAPEATPDSTESAEPAAESFDANAAEQTSTRVVVTGLISVASIANFKRSLGRVPGVWSIGVSSGPDGDFVFTVSHDGGLTLAREIKAMSAFDSKITGESDGEIKVSTHDRDAAD